MNNRVELIYENNEYSVSVNGSVVNKDITSFKPAFP